MDSTGARDTFSRRLAELMRQRGTKQKDLADALNVRAQTVSQYTTGRTTPDYDTLCQIARYYDVSLDWLLGMSEYPKKETEELTVSTLGLSSSAVSGILASKHIGKITGGRFAHTISGLNLLLEQVDFHMLCSDVSDFCKCVSDAEQWETYGASATRHILHNAEAKATIISGYEECEFYLQLLKDNFGLLIEKLSGYSRVRANAVEEIRLRRKEQEEEVMNLVQKVLADMGEDIPGSDWAKVEDLIHEQCD